MKVFTAHLDHNLIVKMIKIRIKKTTAKEEYKQKTAKFL